MWNACIVGSPPKSAYVGTSALARPRATGPMFPLAAYLVLRRQRLVELRSTGRVRAPAPTQIFIRRRTASPTAPRPPAPSDTHSLPERSQTPAVPARMTSENVPARHQSLRSPE